MNPRTEYFLALAMLVVFGFVFVDEREILALVICAFVYCSAKAMKLTEKIESQAKEIAALKEKVRKSDVDS